jgi:hypothetical protein
MPAQVMGEDREITLGADERTSGSRAIVSATAESLVFIVPSPATPRRRHRRR